MYTEELVMKTLVINACARSKSNTHKLYEELMKQHTFENVEILNLYEEEIPFVDSSLLNFIHSNELVTAKDATQKKLIEQFESATTIIIIYPTWNWNVPAVLKAYFDLVFVSKRTFTVKGTKVVGLLNVSQAIIVHTSGAPLLPKMFAYLFNVNTDRFYVKNMMKIAGAKSILHLSLGGFSFKYKDENGKFKTEQFAKDANSAISKIKNKIV